MLGPGQSLLKISFIPAISFYVYIVWQDPGLFKPEVAWVCLPDSDREICCSAPVTVTAGSPGEREESSEETHPAQHHRDAHHHQQDAAALGLQQRIVSDHFIGIA